jgi:hypothetical protein
LPLSGSGTVAELAPSTQVFIKPKGGSTEPRVTAVGKLVAALVVSESAKRGGGYGQGTSYEEGIGG